MTRLTAVDLFSGAGGATIGLVKCGINVIGAVEIDDDAAKTYARNQPDVNLWNSDIRHIKTPAFRKRLGLARGELTILKACPPCQGFSTLSGDRVLLDDRRNSLVLAVAKFVRELMPKFLMIENVPGFANDYRFIKFMDIISDLGYKGRGYVINAKDFGVPQSRRRFIYLATRLDKISLPDYLPEMAIDGKTVRDAFATISSDCDDVINVSRALSPVVAKRVEAVPVGGTRFDIPTKLQLECHKKLHARRDRSASGPYGRMKWERVSPTMTTRCTTVSCGSFIHPDLNRGITLREAAALQSFPEKYFFFGAYGSVERQIGNAVPSNLVAELAKSLLRRIN